MSNGFIKKYRCFEAKKLKSERPFSFLVLDTIAENAKRDSDGHYLLDLGEAIITAVECGVSSQQFETALKHLENEGFIEIVHRGRRDKESKVYARIKPETLAEKSRNTSRINGTVVKLINSKIYDINIEEAPEHIPNQTRNTFPKTPNKEEVKKYKKERNNINIASIDENSTEHNIYNQPLPKTKAPNRKKKASIEIPLEDIIRFEPYVWFKKPAYEKICEQLGKDIVHHFIDRINNEILAKGKPEYKDYAAAIRIWHQNALQWNTMPKKSESKESNAEYAKKCHELYSKKHTSVEMILGHDYVEFAPRGGNAQVIHIKIQENGFKEQIDNALRKYGYK